jgi:predicted ferric reductase
MTAVEHEGILEEENPAGVGRAVQGFVWLMLYVLLVLTPLVVALTANPPPGRGFWLEFSVALGFVGLAILGLQFAIVSRFSSVSAPYGLDAVLQFHRTISFVAFTFVLLHPAIVIIRDNEQLALLNPITAPWRARFGLASIVALMVLVATSVWRTRFRLSYEKWRVMHGALAVLVVLMALLHVEAVGYYVSGPWKRGFWIAMSLALIALLVNIRVVKPIRLLRRPWTVSSIRPEPGDNWILTLRPDGHAGMRFKPGQFAWIRLDRTPFSVRENPFSMSSSAERTDEIEFTISEVGDFTSTLGAVEPGTRAFVDGPYGVFSYEMNEGPEFVFVVGGVGVAPILSMLRTMEDRRDRRPCLLLYANRGWDDIAHRDELDRLSENLDLSVVHVLEDPPEGWTGESGRIDDELLDRHLGTGRHRARFFLCGPPPMMAAVRQLLDERRILGEHIDSERFDIT